ncbi:hypothetical protein P9112_003051 [Eukaryota sp. TZLM1-RC]
MTSSSTAPSVAASAVLVQSDQLPEDSIPVKGYDWDQPFDINKLFESYLTSGFQATQLGKAINVINNLIKCRFGEVEPPTEDGTPFTFDPSKPKCTIFLGYTSNLISSGLRETLCFLVKHRMVDAVVATAGGIEEDVIKCLGPTYLGDFSLKGKNLREKGINRIGNLLVPNDNYCSFEDFFMPLLHQFLDEQEGQNTVWTPSRIIDRLGKAIDDPSSVCYWCHKNNIPVFCPALTDGSMGDMIYFFTYNRPGLVIDLVGDIRKLNDLAATANHTGMIVLGGGLVKHHIFNANLMRNGADYAVVINTSSEFDGSDAGARPDEAVSWGKIKLNGQSAKVYGEATMVFPLIVSQTFHKIVNDSRHLKVKNELIQ